MVLSTIGNSYLVIVMKNMSTPGNLSFVDVYERTLSTGLNDEVSVSDYDGDGAPDFVLTNRNLNTISFYRNTVTNPGDAINSGAVTNVATGTAPYSVTSADVDGDGKVDVVTANQGTGSISAILNTSASGTTSMAPKVDFPAGSYPFKIVASDIDGDGKTDLIVSNATLNSITILKNTSTTGSLSFAPKLQMKGNSDLRGILVADIDSDGKPDILSGNSNLPALLSVFRNRTGDPDSAGLCSNGGATFTASFSGAAYQWQLNTGSGFVNISDNGNYSGTATATLQLTNLPSSFYGYQYRCLVDGNPGANNF